MTLSYDVSTINIVLVLLLLFLPSVNKITRSSKIQTRNKKSRYDLQPCCQRLANCQHRSAAPISRSFGTGSLSL